MIVVQKVETKNLGKKCTVLGVIFYNVATRLAWKIVNQFQLTIKPYPILSATAANTANVATGARSQNESTATLTFSKSI